MDDRVRRRTAAEVLRRIDDDTFASVVRAADAAPSELASRLDALDREWDMDRVLEVDAAATGLLGLALALIGQPVFLALPVLAAGSLLLQARTGRHPMLPMYRRMGVRTAREILRERHATKALRGDFSGMDARQASFEGMEPGPMERRRSERRRPHGQSASAPSGAKTASAGQAPSASASGTQPVAVDLVGQLAGTAGGAR